MAASSRARGLRTLSVVSENESVKLRLVMGGICFLGFFTLIPSTQRSDPLNGGSSTAGCEKREQVRIAPLAQRVTWLAPHKATCHALEALAVSSSRLGCSLGPSSRSWGSTHRAGRNPEAKASAWMWSLLDHPTGRPLERLQKQNRGPLERKNLKGAVEPP